MDVVICPKCHTEMGFEKLPTYVDCKKCSHQFLSLNGERPSVIRNSEGPKRRERKSPAEQQLWLLRSMSVVFIGFALMLPSVIHSATGAEAPLASIVGVVGFLLFAAGLITFITTQMIDR